MSATAVVGRSRAGPMMDPVTVEQTSVRRIRRVEVRADATHVVKQGGRTPLYVKLVDGVTVGEVRQYCTEHVGWNVAELPVSVDGMFHEMPGANAVVLGPTTRRVEFRQRTTGHG